MNASSESYVWTEDGRMNVFPMGFCLCIIRVDEYFPVSSVCSEYG